MTPRHSFQDKFPITAQKGLLTYKLFLLENARNSLEEELRNFTNQAYEEVHSVLNSSFPTSVVTDLIKTLDVKYQNLLKLSALLNSFAIDPEVCLQPAIKKEVRINQVQPFRVKRSLITNVIKFGPMLQNSFMATSIAKAVQMVGGALSRQSLKVFLNLQPASVHQDDMLGSISSTFNSTDVTKSSSCHSKVKEQVLSEEKSQPDSVCGPSVIAQHHKMNEVKPQVLLPPLQAVFPENSNPKPIMMWGHGDEVQVQHQKQTSSQLLHFLRIKSKNLAPEVTHLDWGKDKYEADSSDSPQQMSPTVKTQAYQLKCIATDKMIDALPPKTLHVNVDNPAPVFRVKRLSSSGTLTYSCVIATETELWDIGDTFVEVLEKDSLHCSLEHEECQNIITQMENSCTNMDWKTQDLQPKEPEQENSSAVTEMQSVQIPEFQFWRFKEIEVTVSHMVGPDNFYIQHADSPKKLQALVTDKCKVGRSYAEQNCIPDIGAQVIGWFPQKEEWCRGQVMKMCGVSKDNNAMDGGGIESSIKVEVKRLDYGDTFCLSLWNIKELSPEVAALPLQALQVSLANVMPVNGEHWSEEAVGWIKTMVQNRTLYARLYPQGPTFTVDLFLERGKLGAMRRGASLSLRLAQNGHARHNELKNGARKKSGVQLKTQKEDSDWEKFLISHYTQLKK